MPPPDAEFAYIPRFPGYAISKGGRVFSCRRHRDRWKPKKPMVMARGRNRGEWVVSLYYDREGETRLVWIPLRDLVIMAWLPPRPEGHLIAYRDGDRANIHADNLFWQPRKEQVRERKLRGERVSWMKLTNEAVAAIRREVYDQAATGQRPDFDAIGAKYGVCGKNIAAVATRKTWQHVEDGIPAWVPPPRKPFGRSRCKLTEADARRIKIRLARGERVLDIARDYAHLVNPRSLYSIKYGKAWSHVKV